MSDVEIGNSDGAGYVVDADVVVAGLGVTGAAVARELARRGIRVIGIDARDPPHADGSSHGATRIIREAYFEHPLYVPLVQRAYEQWSALERESGTTLYQRTGGLAAGPEHGALVAGVLRSVREHALAHDCFDAAGMRARFPALAPPPDWVGIYEPNAGALFAESCVRVLHGLARTSGATLHCNTALLRWMRARDGLEVETSSGTVRTACLVLALGSWLRQFVTLPLTIERQVVFWFEPRTDPQPFSAGQCPIVLWEYMPDRIAYTFPELGHGIKAGIHHCGETCTPDSVSRSVRAEEEQAVRRVMEEFMPGGAGRRLNVSVCLYTNSPDFNFVLDYHPEDEHVIIASACSGHGFKFAPVVAEIVADLCSHRDPAFDITPFRIERMVSR